MNMDCEKCGSPISESFKFCRQCGATAVPAPSPILVTPELGATRKKNPAIWIISISLMICAIIGATAALNNGPSPVAASMKRSFNDAAKEQLRKDIAAGKVRVDALQTLGYTNQQIQEFMYSRDSNLPPTKEQIAADLKAIIEAEPGVESACVYGGADGANGGASITIRGSESSWNGPALLDAALRTVRSVCLKTIDKLVASFPIDDLSMYQVEITVPTVDRYGNDSRSSIRIWFPIEELRKVNWKRFEPEMLMGLANAATAAPIGRKVLAEWCGDNQNFTWSQPCRFAIGLR